MNDEQSNNVKKDQESHQESNVVAMFVVQFDVHKGNVLEWQYPPEFDLQGIEYQAICSGLHRIESDVVYFSRSSYYGISVFQNMSIDTSRGAYMKAVGLVVKPTKSTGACGNVWKHKNFLMQELSHFMTPSQSAEPTQYEGLIEYYNRHKYQERQVESDPIYMSWLHDKSLLYAAEHSVNFNLAHNIVSVNHDLMEASDLPEFVKLFGPDIFVLWKAALLRKRIMFIDVPPMETSFYSMHLMGHIPDKFKSVKPIIPKFTVGVNDIPELEKSSDCYIACTPDTIFQIKSDLYDLMITFPTLPFSHPVTQTASAQQIALSDLRTKTGLEIKSSIPSVPSNHNPADVRRYRILQRLVENQSFDLGSKSSSSSLCVADFYYWLYEEQDELQNEQGELFCRSSGQGTARASSPSSRRESRELLADEEQDALEINPNEILEVVAARASSEMLRTSTEYQQQQSINNTLINFFQQLTFFLLLTLQDIISTNERDDITILWPKDMVELGLDPLKDTEFVIELARLYFNKEIQVRGIPDWHACCSACCLQGRDRQYIRI
ncbi:hypothetical protein RMCBS344292_03957 [Rhizopus microsporus]|nr:hypothetical protein RMCBS344292_03957 [Rhizopus microsporus]